MSNRRETDWELVKIIYDDICRLLTLKQYLAWTKGVARGGSYEERLDRVGKVTKNKRILKLAKAALFEIQGPAWRGLEDDINHMWEG